MCERCVGLSKGLSLLHHDLLMCRVMITLVLRLGGESPFGGWGERGAQTFSKCGAELHYCLNSLFQ